MGPVPLIKISPRQVLYQRLNIFVSSSMDPNLFQKSKILVSSNMGPSMFLIPKSWKASKWAQVKYCFIDWISWWAPFLGPRNVTDNENWRASVWTKTLFQKLKTWWAPNGPKHCSSYQNLGEIKIGPKHCFRNWVFARQTNNPSDCALLQDKINCAASSEPDFIQNYNLCRCMIDCFDNRDKYRKSGLLRQKYTILSLIWVPC